MTDITTSRNQRRVTTRSRLRRWMQRAGAAVGTLMVLALLVGATIERVLRTRATTQHAPTGRLIDIGGRHLHLDCRGSGSPTIVLESGLDHLGSQAWAAIHDSLAHITRVCAYSRAGLPWSDGAPTNFDVRVAMRDLHRALTVAGERTPWLMVGHSLGGPYALVYTQLFQREVAGVVLVDATHPAQRAVIAAAVGHAVEPPLRLFDAGVALAWTGVLRLASGGATVDSWSASVRTIGAAFFPRSLRALRAELRALDTTLAVAASATNLGSRPLVVLTAGAPANAGELAVQGLSVEQGARKHDAWLTLQRDMATWSSATSHQIVRNASHYIQFDAPDAVIQAVSTVVRQIRSRAIGSTPEPLAAPCGDYVCH